MGCQESTASKEALNQALETVRAQADKRQEEAKLAKLEEENETLKAQVAAIVAGKYAPAQVAASSEVGGADDGELSQNDHARINDLRSSLGIDSRLARTSSAAMNERLEEKEKEVLQLRTHVSNLTARLETAHGDDALRLIKAEQERDALRHQLNEVVPSITADKEAMRRRAEAAAAELAVQKAAYQTLEANFNALKGETAVLQRHVADGKSQQLILRRELEDTKSELFTLRTNSSTSAAGFTADRERYEEKVAQLEARCAELAKVVDDARCGETSAQSRLQEVMANQQTNASRLEELERAAAQQKRDGILLKSVVQLIVGPKCTDDTLARSIVTIACESAGLPTREGWKPSDVALRSLRFADVPFGDAIASLSAMVIRRNPNLSSIELGASSLTDLGAGELAVTLTLAQHKLQGIYLIQNFITLRGAQWLVDACRTVPHSFELNMTRNPIVGAIGKFLAPPQEAARAFVQQVAQLCKARPNLTIEYDDA